MGCRRVYKSMLMYMSLSVLDFVEIWYIYVIMDVLIYIRIKSLL